MIFDNLFDSKVLALLGISLLLFVLGALKRSRDIKVRGDVITKNQVAGFILWQAFERSVNYALYPVVVVVFGIIRGGLIMIVVTFVQNIIYILVNNSTKEDWTFMSWFTFLRDSKSHVWPLRYYRVLQKLQIQTFMKFLIGCLWFLRKIFGLKIGRLELSNTVGFLYLTVWKDSFYAVNFLFHKKTDLRKAKVMGLFIVSHVICNIVWAPIARGIGFLGQYILNLFASF